MKNIQISEKLFIQLVKYHLLDNKELSEEIKIELDDKLTKLINRDLYSKYLQAEHKQDKREALEEYINHKSTIL